MSTKANIIIIEDERNICSFISRVLEPEGYRVITAATGREGLQHITSDHPDLILLDLGLPDMDGLKLIESVRSWSTTPIIVISARTMETSKVEALDMGADDYLTKPFGTGELLARIRTALRHAQRGHDRRNALSSWRISLSHLTTEQEITDFMQAFDACYNALTQ